MSSIDYAIEYLTKMLIKQHIEDLEKNKKEYMYLSKEDFLKKSIKLLKLIEQDIKIS